MLPRLDWIFMNPHFQAQTVGRASPGPVGLPVLLLPGTVCDRRVFAPLLELLGDMDASIGDMRGANTMPDLARKLLAQAPPRFVLVGFSLGGIAALEMIAQQPHRIERLCLIDTTPRPDPAANAASRRAAVARARSEGMEQFILDAWPNLVSPGNTADASLRETICAMARDAGPDVLAEQSELAINRADSRPRLADIDVPTLILAGESERVCPLEAHREMADTIPNATLHLIPNAGHFAPLENPAAIAGHIRRWLDAAPVHPIAQ